MGVRIVREVFEPGVQTAAMHAANAGVGAVVSFIGYMRDYNDGLEVSGMYLEYYPGMTERALDTIEAQARRRWPLLGVEILHRVGDIEPGEPIVFVGTASAHRQAAFEACAFIMDYLKTRAPLWKKERGTQGERWVDGRESDRQAMDRWQASDDEPPVS